MKLYVECGEYKHVGEYYNKGFAMADSLSDALAKHIRLSPVIFVSEAGFFSDIDKMENDKIASKMLYEGDIIRTSNGIKYFMLLCKDAGEDVMSRLKELEGEFKEMEKDPKVRSLIEDNFKKKGRTPPPNFWD